MKRLLFIFPALFLLRTVAGQVSLALDRADQGRQFATAPAQNWDQRGPWSQLRREADHLNDMAAHTRSLMRRYGATPYHRDELSRVREDISRIINKVSAKVGDRDRIYRSIQNARAALHRLEIQLNFRSRDYYRW